MSRSGAGRALARIYAAGLRPRFLAVSEWFPSASPLAGLLLDKKGQRTFTPRALRPGGDVVQRPTEAAAETGAERALARIYTMDLRPRFLAVSEWFPSDSPLS